jgi:O-antigen ligase
MTFTILFILARHSLSGFSFESVHQVLHPFYRNHVAYASLLVVFFPFLLLARRWYPPGSARRILLNAAIGLYIPAIYLAYTRAAYVALIIALGAYFVIRLGLTRYLLAGAIIGALTLTLFLANDNRYLELAPNYERTVTHRDFENLLEATYQGEDISTMERVYRWIAGFYMSQEKPFLGFGPGNFSFFYKPYTVKSFQTYVSDNPGHSGIHSYYLMLVVEQGYTGLLLFFVLVWYTLVRGEGLYHQLRGRRREIAMTTLLSLIIILALLIINDLVETDKIGPFFFIHLALLVNLDRRAQKELA